MVDPLTSLIVGFIIILFLIWVYLPRKGLLARLKRSKKNTHRVLIEDSLKHLYNCEYNGINCTLNSVAGNVSISADEASKVVKKLEELELITSHERGISLTPEGRAYALRIIRTHRLWEKYLADETSVGEEDWHIAAEEIEHHITPAQADALAAQIGNPVFDPHGDPIPSAKGDLPVKKGNALNTLKTGEFARIIHIEDEPNAIYSQLVAAGLYPGMQVRMIESSKDRIKFLANGEEVVLAPLFAKNVTIIPIKNETTVKGKFKSLSSLSVGEKGIVLGISKRCRGQQRRRLMDLGVVPGTEIEAEMKSIGGDPVAYRIRGASIALRKNQADKIYLINEE
ncbi:MAG: metal-dependent transcriptional regulator [Bacteroidetes bacterium]|nr:metal-dependent transcriptional regulator [Bacteroidota bacterium]